MKTPFPKVIPAYPNRLAAELNEILADPTLHNAAARSHVAGRYDARIVAAFYDHLDPVGHDAWAERDGVIELPGAAQGYSRWSEAFYRRGRGSTTVRARDLKAIYDGAAPIAIEMPDEESTKFLFDVRVVVANAIKEQKGIVKGWELCSHAGPRRVAEMLVFTSLTMRHRTGRRTTSRKWCPVAVVRRTVDAEHHAVLVGVCVDQRVGRKRGDRPVGTVLRPDQCAGRRHGGGRPDLAVGLGLRPVNGNGNAVDLPNAGLCDRRSTPRWEKRIGRYAMPLRSAVSVPRCSDVSRTGRGRGPTQTEFTLAERGRDIRISPEKSYGTISLGNPMPVKMGKISEALALPLPVRTRRTASADSRDATQVLFMRELLTSLLPPDS